MHELSRPHRDYSLKGDGVRIRARRERQIALPDGGRRLSVRIRRHDREPRLVDIRDVDADLPERLLLTELDLWNRQARVRREVEKACARRDAHGICRRVEIERNVEI